jgi:TRAP transporter TatT component family protein
MRSLAFSWLLGASIICLSPIGCVKKMLINGQIEGTRQASTAFDSIGDWELAYKAASSGIVQFEGMHKLAPDNDDALFLLTKGWTGYGYGFAEDEMEEAQDAGDRELEEHHRRRAIMAYERAIQYGTELLSHRAKGFEEAKKGEADLKAWLEKNFKTPDDGGNLFWAGYAWIARTNLMKDDAEAVAQLWVGVQMIERSVAIDPSYNAYSGLVVLAGYHARTAMAEMDEAKKLFDEAIAKTEGKSLMVQFQYAARYACAKADAGLYGKLLGEVVKAEDPDPNLRLTNTIAKRRAKRWLGEKRMFDACSMEPAPPPEAKPATRAPLRLEDSLPLALLEAIR